jgi:hypothetical protein
LLVEVWMVDSGGTEWLTAGSHDSGTVVLKPLWGGPLFQTAGLGSGHGLWSPEGCSRTLGGRDW